MTDYWLLMTGDWLLMTDDWLLIIFTRKTRRTRIPQAEGVRERESSGINRELKEMGPQADEGGERQLENNKYPQMSQMDTD